MKIDESTDANLVSAKLVTEVLKTHITPTSKNGFHPIGDKYVETAGSVDLIWCFHATSRKIYKVRFSVTAAWDPPFDLIVGRKTIL